MKRISYSCGAVLVALLVCGVPGRAGAGEARPKLLDLGAKTCIPCKLMAPILESMKKEFRDTLEVEFVDVGERENRPVASRYNIRLIPTQIFLGPDGKEVWRHEGFISRYGILDKWSELGYDFAVKALAPPFERLEPAGGAPVAAGAACFLCDGPVAAASAVTVDTGKGAVSLCGPHHFFVMLSCLREGTEAAESSATVADAGTGRAVRMTEAVYLHALDETTGAPRIRAFAERAAAEAERAASGGSILSYPVLKDGELAVRCGFCDRAVYPADAAAVTIDGIHSWGCCAHCAMGVAVRSGANIEVTQPDRLTGEPVVIKTLGGYVASVSPVEAVGWFGLRRKADGTFGSAGCFHQGFFASEANLREWLERNPSATGREISIDRSLADKMKLNPQQIANACKIGECAPK